MGRFVNIDNIVVIEQAETAGACVGFLLGAATGARIGLDYWWLGPVAIPITVGSILVGGTVGAVGGSNLGKLIVSQLT